MDYKNDGSLEAFEVITSALQALNGYIAKLTYKPFHRVYMYFFVEQMSPGYIHGELTDPPWDHAAFDSNGGRWSKGVTPLNAKVKNGRE